MKRSIKMKKVRKSRFKKKKLFPDITETISIRTCVFCRFWAKLHDLCPLSDGSGLPLSSAFCQGHGDAFFCMGQVQRMLRPKKMSKFSCSEGCTRKKLHKMDGGATNGFLKRKLVGEELT